jgi:hypothetical protein
MVNFSPLTMIYTQKVFHNFHNSKKTFKRDSKISAHIEITLELRSIHQGNASNSLKRETSGGHKLRPYRFTTSLYDCIQQWQHKKAAKRFPSVNLNWCIKELRFTSMVEINMFIHRTKVIIMSSIATLT